MISRDEVEAWVRTKWLEDVPDPDGVRRWNGSPSASSEEAVRYLRGLPEADVSVLTYAIHVGDGTLEERRLPVRAGSFLGDLAKAADELADRFGWSVAEAVLFVLTDERPWVSPIRGEVRVRIGGPSTVSSRLTIEVDPVVTPTELADWYQGVRAGIVGRYQPMSPKHLELAAFASENDGPWRDVLAAWNAAHEDERPEWRYFDTDTTRAEVQFARDASRAPRRLMLYPYRRVQSNASA